MKVSFIFFISCILLSCTEYKRNQSIKIINSIPLVFSYQKPIDYYQITDTLNKVFYKDYIIFTLGKVADFETNMNIKGSDFYLVFKKDSLSGVQFHAKQQQRKKMFEICNVDSVLKVFNLSTWLVNDDFLKKRIEYNKINNNEVNVKYIKKSKVFYDTLSFTLNRNLLKYHSNQFPQIEEIYKMGIKDYKALVYIDSTKLIMNYSLNLDVFDDTKIPLYERFILVHDSLMQLKNSKN